jgi:hypothetical protein
MNLLAYACHTTSGGEYNHNAMAEFRSLLSAEWDAITWCSFEGISEISIYVDTDKIADMTYREIVTKTQSAIDLAHAKATHWNWLHFDLGKLLPEPPTKHCKNCRYWVPSLMRCSALTSRTHQPLPDNGFELSIYGVDEDPDGRPAPDWDLRTGPEFGCVLFNQKEEPCQTTQTT